MTAILDPRYQAIRDVKQVYENMTTLFRSADAPLGDVLLASTEFFAGSESLYLVGRFRFAGRGFYDALVIEMPAAHLVGTNAALTFVVNGGHVTLAEAVPFVRGWYDTQEPRS